MADSAGRAGRRPEASGRRGSRAGTRRGLRFNAFVTLGRNDPCHCGSGRKYKRCHLDADLDTERVVRRVTPEMIRAVQEKSERYARRLREGYGVYINYVTPVQWQGRKVWAIGTRVYADRPPKETFHEFLIHVLRTTLTEEWRAAQAALPEEQRHFVLKCSAEYDRWTTENSNAAALQTDGRFAAHPNGWVQYLISLAWDVATLIHASNLSDALLDRLRDSEQFQGARYEVAVAAILARLDCEIEFIDDNQLRSQPHVEFIATDRRSGARVAVEAKSRHRRGVINFPGDYDEEDAVRGDVQRLFEKALAKAPGESLYMIFIDVNAPPALNTGVENQWQTDVKRWMAELHPPDSEESQAYSALCATNFSPHYDGDDLAQGSEWLYIQPPRPVASVEPRFGAMLCDALERYHRVPGIDEDGELLG